MSLNCNIFGHKFKPRYEISEPDKSYLDRIIDIMCKPRNNINDENYKTIAGKYFYIINMDDQIKILELSRKQTYLGDIYDKCGMTIPRMYG
jgi:hypothetical protein